MDILKSKEVEPKEIKPKSKSKSKSLTKDIISNTVPRDKDGKFSREDLEKLSVEDILDNLLSLGYSQKFSNCVRLEWSKSKLLE